MSDRSRTKWPFLLLAIPLVVAFLYLAFANTLIKRTLETELGQAYGAEVNIGTFDHGLFPLTVSLSEVQLTNASQPSYNQLAIATVTGDVEWGPLLAGDIVMNEVNVLGIQLNQRRDTPGAVFRQPGQTFSLDDFDLPGKDDIPDIDTLLARSPLQTTTAVQRAQNTYDKHYTQLQEEYRQLPDKSVIDGYKLKLEEIKALSKGGASGIAQAAAQLTELKQQLRAEKSKVSTFLNNAKTAQTALAASARDIQSASVADYEEMSLLLAGDQAAFARVTQTVFGKEFAQYSEYLTMAFNLIVPMLRGEEGPTDTTPSTPPPFVWVKKANVSLDWQNNEWVSQWQDITTLHDRLGQPTRFSLNGLHEQQTFATAGEFFIGDNGVNGKQQWDIQNLLLDAIQLADSDDLAALLESSNLAAVGSLAIVNNQLSGSSDINLSAVNIDANSTTTLGKVIAQVLNELSQLTVNANLGGSLNAPDLAFSSDLDNQIAQRLASQISGIDGEQNPQLTQKLAEMTGVHSERLEQGLGDISQWLALAEGDSASLDKLLAAKTDSLVDKGKNRLLDKLKLKLQR